MFRRERESDAHAESIPLLVFGLILVFALLLVPVARADEWDQATRLTFNQPMEIPGHKILAAGSYWFVTMADMANPESGADFQR